MEFAVECRSAKSKKFIEAVMPNMIKLLGLTTSKYCVLVRVAHETDGDDGLTIPVPGLQAYIIVIRPSASLREIGVTLAHEMVHVKQLSRGYLRVKNGARYWCGKRYRKNHRYMASPWELDAFSKQEIIFRLAIE